MDTINGTEVKQVLHFLIKQEAVKPKQHTIIFSFVAILGNATIVHIRDTCISQPGLTKVLF